MSTWILARAFVIEAARNRLFYVAIGMTAVIIGVSFLISPLSLGTGEKITRDLGLASLVWCAALMLFTGGVHLMGREIEQKSVYFLLTRPVSRGEYLVGKFLGMVLTAWSVLGLAAAVFAVGLFLRGSAPDPALAQAALLAMFELVVLSALVVFFTALASPIPAMLYAFSTFVAGHTMAGLLGASVEEATGTSRIVLDLLRWVIPDLSRFDMRLHAVHGVTIPLTDIGASLAYAVIYSAAVLCLAAAVFQRRELE